MALPKLNEVPNYELVIPSTQEKVKFRPYLVKEEKVLMIAMESEDQVQILNAIGSTIESCVSDYSHINSLPTFDIEYMFLQIRSKSVGETITLNLKCEKCEEPNEHQVLVDDIKVVVPDIDHVIKISEDISLEMKWPSFISLMDKNIIDNSSVTDQTFKLLTKCINCVLTEDDRIVFKDEMVEDQIAFIESLNTDQFMKIQEYLQAMPALKHNIEYACSSCNHENKITLQGFNDFF
jgi:hypothetical protein